MPLLAADAYTAGVAAALEALARFRLVSALLPDLRFGQADAESLREVLCAINDCLDSCCDRPDAPLTHARNAAGAARLLLRDHLMTEARARRN